MGKVQRSVSSERSLSHIRLNLPRFKSGSGIRLW